LISTVSYPRIETSKQQPEPTYFGRGNFRAGVDVNTAVCFTRDGRTDSVDNTHAECATLQIIPHGQDRVGGLSDLTNEHADVIAENRCLPVQEV